MPQTSGSASSRNGSIDLARWLGCVGIVVFHLGSPGAWIGYAGLPMFMLLVVYFGANRPVPERLQRLLTPFVLWSVIYGAVKILEAVLRGKPLAAEFPGWMLFTGPALHLWFLPFAAGFLALAALLRGPALLVGVGTVASAVAVWAANTQPLPIPLFQWSQVIPAAFAGVAMARMPRPDLWCLGLGTAAAVLWVAGLQQIAPQTTIAAAVVYAALKIKLPSTRLTRALGGMSLGVYLIHPMIGAVGLMLSLEDPVFLAMVLVLAHLGTLVLQRLAPRLVS